MPIIKDYECPSCGWLFESWHVENKPHSPPICPTCKIHARHVFRPLGIVLKGIGWARDGYSKDIDDVEEFWKRDGKPVGKYVG
jgi:putative FmdB family regulatory protein